MVPALLDYEAPLWIKMLHVTGWPYLNDLASFNPATLGSTLAQFHLATFQDGHCLCHIDNQPANILFDGTDYFFIDFGDSHNDTPETDLTHLLLFWASDLPTDVFSNLARQFLSAYHSLLPIYVSAWEAALTTSISRFDGRRLALGKSLGHNDHPIILNNRKILSQLDSLLS